MPEEMPREPTILITGFGEFLDIKINPSWEVASRLPTTINGVRILVHPSPLKAVYHSLLEVPKLLEEHQPDAVIHMGLAVERIYYAIEKGADRDRYHEIPDEAKRVFSRPESKKLWGKSPPRLDSTFDIEEILIKWKENASLKTNSKGKSKGKSDGDGKGGGKEADLRASDDVGNYVCGFVYYITLEWFWKRNGPQGEKKVLFFHVPALKGEADFEKGKDVTVALIKAVIRSGQL